MNDPDLQQQLWSRRQTDQYINTVDLNTYDKKIRAWFKEMLAEQIKLLEKAINSEIERVVKDQDERCITELCKVVDEKLDEFREELGYSDE